MEYITYFSSPIRISLLSRSERALPSTLSRSFLLFPNSLLHFYARVYLDEGVNPDGALGARPAISWPVLECAVAGAI